MYKKLFAWSFVILGFLKTAFIVRAEDCPEGTVCTALGKINTNPTELVNTILTIAIGVGGGIAFLMIVFGGFRLVFSQGDPKAIQEARETITSAIIGLLLIVFSVFLLNLIGVDILGLPL